MHACALDGSDDVLVEHGALLERLVQRYLAQLAAHGCLRQLHHRKIRVLHPVRRAHRVYDLRQQGSMRWHDPQGMHVLGEQHIGRGMLPALIFGPLLPLWAEVAEQHQSPTACIIQQGPSQLDVVG